MKGPAYDKGLPADFYLAFFFYPTTEGGRARETKKGGGNEFTALQP
jgi:hypothetical protein